MPVPLLTSLLVAVAAALPQAVETPEAAPLHPDFKLPTVDGGSGRLADHLGAKTVVFHFASW